MTQHDTTNWESLLWQPLYTVRATRDYRSEHVMDLSFVIGDVIEVLGIENDDWVNGTILDTNRFGSFPKMFVEVIASESEAKQNPVASTQEQIEPQQPERKPKLPARNPSSSIQERIEPQQPEQKPRLPARKPSSNEPEPKLPSSKSSLSKPKAALAARLSNELLRRDSYAESIAEIDRGGIYDPPSQCTPVTTSNFEGYLDCAVIDFEVIDEHARNTPQNVASSVKRLAEYLTLPWDYPIYKLRCLFTWIAVNIEYDMATKYSTNRVSQKPIDVIKSRKAGSTGYAGLFEALAVQAELDVWTVNGEAKGADYKPGSPITGHTHTWNATLLDGEYRLIDCAWGAGNVCDKKFTFEFNPYYFLASPLTFAYSNHPSDPKQQYLDPQLSTVEFRSLPFVTPHFWNACLSFPSQNNYLIEVDYDVISLDVEQAPKDDRFVLMAKLIWGGEVVKGYVAKLVGVGPLGGRVHRVHCTVPDRGEGILQLLDATEGQHDLVVASFKVISHGDGIYHTPLPTFYNTPHESSILTPLHRYLTLNSSVLFEMVLYSEQGRKSLPEVLVLGPSLAKQKRFGRVECNDKDGSYKYSMEVRVDKLGFWRIGFKNSMNRYSYFVEYEVVEA